MSPIPSHLLISYCASAVSAVCSHDVNGNIIVCGSESSPHGDYNWSAIRSSVPGTLNVSHWYNVCGEWATKISSTGIVSTTGEEALLNRSVAEG